MAVGLTRSEQAALIASILAIVGAMGWQSFRSGPSEGVWIEPEPGWRPVALASPTPQSPPREIGAPLPAATPAAALPTAPPPRSGAVAAIDLNKASVEELDRLPGIGPAKAAAIVDHRERLGAFASVEDFLKVKGIGNSDVEKIRSYIVALPERAPTPPLTATPQPITTASAPQPVMAVAAPAAPTPRAPAKVNLNTATAEQLQTLPGIGPVLAERIIAYRRGRAFRRPEDLLAVRGIGEKTHEKLRGLVTAP